MKHTTLSGRLFNAWTSPFLNKFASISLRQLTFTSANKVHGSKRTGLQNKTKPFQAIYGTIVLLQWYQFTFETLSRIELIFYWMFPQSDSSLFNLSLLSESLNSIYMYVYIYKLYIYVYIYIYIIDWLYFIRINIGLLLLLLSLFVHERYTNIST